MIRLPRRTNRPAASIGRSMIAMPNRTSRLKTVIQTVMQTVTQHAPTDATSRRALPTLIRRIVPMLSRMTAITKLSMPVSSRIIGTRKKRRTPSAGCQLSCLAARAARYADDDQAQDGSDDQAYALDDYEEDAPEGRRRGGFVVVAAVLGLAVLGTAGAFAYRAMFGGSILPSLPPIIRAEDGPNRSCPHQHIPRRARRTRWTRALRIRARSSCRARSSRSPRRHR